MERHRQFPWFGTVEAVLEKNLVTFLAMFFAVKWRLCWQLRQLSVVTGGFGFVPTFRRFLLTCCYRTNFEACELRVWGQGFVGECTCCTPEPPRLCLKCVVSWQSQVSCQRLEAVHCGLLKGRIACGNGRRCISNGTWLLSIAEQKSALELVCRIDGLLSPSRILEEEF